MWDGGERDNAKSEATAGNNRVRSARRGVCGRIELMERRIVGTEVVNQVASRIKRRGLISVP